MKPILLVLACASLSMGAVQQTTLAAALTATGTSVILSSSTGVSPAGVSDIRTGFYIDREYMEAQASTATNTWTVRRAAAGTRSAHALGAVVYAASPAEFSFALINPSGNCARGQQSLPLVVIPTGDVFDCPSNGTGWTLSTSTNPAIATDFISGLMLANEHMYLDLTPNYFPGTLPAATANAPSITDCTTLVTSLAPLVAQYAARYSALLQVIHRETTTNQTAATYTYAGISGSIAALANPNPNRLKSTYARTGDFSTFTYTDSTHVGTLTQTTVNQNTYNFQNGREYEFKYTIASYTGNPACNITTAFAAATTAMTMANGAQIVKFIAANTLGNFVVSCTSTSGGFVISALSLEPTPSEVVQVDVMNATSTLMTDLASRLGMQAASMIDGAVFSQYASLSTNTPVGVPGNNPATAVLDSALITLERAGRGLPVFVMVPYDQAPLQRGQYKTGKLLLTMGPIRTGSGAPNTTHTMAMLPSAFAVQTSIETTLSSDSTHIEVAGTVSGTVSVVVGITNTGSGVQVVYVRVNGVTLLLDEAKAVEIQG